MLNGGCNALIVRWLCGIAENRVFAPNIFLVQKKCVVFNIDCWAFSVSYVFMRLCLVFVVSLTFRTFYMKQKRGAHHITPWIEDGTAPNGNCQMLCRTSNRMDTSERTAPGFLGMLQMSGF